MTSDSTSIAASSLRLSRQSFLRRYKNLFFLIAVIASALPGFAPLKVFAVIVLWGYMVVADSFTIGAGLWFVSVLLNLMLGAQVGAAVQSVPLQDVFDHFLRLIIFFIILGIGTYTASQCSVSQRWLDQLIFVIAVCLMFFKLVIAGALLSGISLDRIQAMLGFDTPTSGIGFGLQRLQFPSDIIAPFLIACYVGGQKKSKDCILLLSVAGVVLLSFSRYLFAFYLLCAFVRALWIKKADFISLVTVIVALACGITFFDSIILRFASAQTTISDQTRADQIHYLRIGIKNFPLFGTGIGSRAHDYLRNEKTPYFYEAQWYATVMQLGGVGAFWYIANLLLAVYVPLRKNYIAFTIVFLIWICSGFTNPFLTALGSAFGLSILLLRCNVAGAPRAPTPAIT